MPTPLTLETLRNDLAYVEEQLKHHGDPQDTVRLMWENRREALRDEIARIEETQDNFASVALLFNGEPVLGSEEIRLDFATRALEGYQSILTALFSERIGNEPGAR